MKNVNNHDVIATQEEINSALEVLGSDFTKKQLEDAIQSVRINELTKNSNILAQKFLSDTDWYVTRFSETGVAIPEEVATKRQEARDAIVH